MVCLQNMLQKLVAQTRERESKRLSPLVKPFLRFLFVVFLAFTFFLPQFPISLVAPVKASTGNWYDTSYKYRRAITVDNSSNASILTNFETKITLSSSNFDFTKAQSSGQDIRFTDNDGTTLLNHWIEAYDNIGQTATIYVQVPSLSASSTHTIYVYYGNSSVATISNIKNTFNSYIYSSEWSQGTVDSTAYSAFPVAVKLSNGNILVCYSTGSAHSSNDQKAVCSISTDGGITFGSGTTAYDTSNKSDLPYALTQLSTGEVLMGMVVQDVNVSTSAQSYILKSTDNGVTWQTPVLITNPFSSWLNVFGNFIELSNGNVLLSAYAANTGETTRSVLLQSTDKGATWTLKSTIAYNASKNYSETSIVQIDSNNFLAAIREDLSGAPWQRIHTATSSDGGSTWTTPTAFLAHDGGTSPNLKKLSNGHIVLAYGQRGLNYNRVPGIFAAVSTDNGSTWGANYPVFMSADTSWVNRSTRGIPSIGYPYTIELSSGKLFTAYYSKTDPVITTDATAATIYRTIWTEDSSGKFADDIESGTGFAWSFSGTNTGVSTDVAHSGSYSLKALDGVTNRTTTANAIIFNGNPTDGEVNFWFYPVVGANANQIYLQDYQQKQRFIITIDVNGTVTDSSSTNFGTISYNQWTKFTIVFHTNTNSGTLYINGVNKGDMTNFESGGGINAIQFTTGSTGGVGEKFYVDDVYTRNYIATDPPTTVGSENSQISSGISLNNDPTGQSSGKTRITGNANTGNSSYTISDVNYSVNGGSWQGATATDGSFNSSNENFYLDFLPTDNNYSGDGYTIRVKAQSSSGVWQDNLFYFQPFNLDSPSNNSFTTNSLPTFGFSINKGEFSNLKDNLSKFQVLINKDNKGWQTYIDNIPVDYTSVQNNGDNLQKNSLATNGNGVYENNKIWVNYSNNNSSLQVYSKAVDSLGNASDKYFQDGGHKLDSGSYQFKVVAVDKSGHSQETETRKLRVSSKQFNQSRSWFPLTVNFISGVGNLDLSTIHPQDVKDEYFTSYSAPTIKGIANAGTTVTLTKEDTTCETKNGTDCTNSYTAVTGIDSRYLITFPDNSLRYGRPYIITLSVKDSGDNYNELPSFNLKVGSFTSEPNKIEQATESPSSTTTGQNIQPTPMPKPTTAKKHCFLFICW